MVQVIAKERMDALLSGINKASRNENGKRMIEIDDPYTAILGSFSYFIDLTIKAHTKEMDTIEVLSFIEDLSWYRSLVQSINEKKFVESWGLRKCDPQIMDNDDYAEACRFYYRAVVQRDADAIIESLVSNAIDADEREVFMVKDAI